MKNNKTKANTTFMITHTNEQRSSLQMQQTAMNDTCVKVIYTVLCPMMKDSC